MNRLIILNIKEKFLDEVAKIGNIDPNIARTMLDLLQKLDDELKRKD